MVQSLNRNLFVLQPAAEISDGDDLPSNRVVSIALFGDSGCIGVKVFAQRALAKPFNGAWESEELVYHPSRVSGVIQKLCRALVAEMPKTGRWHFNMRHSPGRGIVQSIFSPAGAAVEGRGKSENVEGPRRWAKNGLD